MSEQPEPTPVDPLARPSQPQQPAWDREAARARYRRMMRSWPMRLSYVVLILVLLFAWGWGIAAAFAPDVENLAGHDIAVPVSTCVTCHTAGAQAAGAPVMNHPPAPSCGFCHRQALPEGMAPAGGWVRRIEN